MDSVPPSLPPALSCPPHSHYEMCTRSCDFTCAALSVPTHCTERCFEGCQCDDGYLFDGASCVPLYQCGCVRDGRYLQVSAGLQHDDRIQAEGLSISYRWSCHSPVSFALSLVPTLLENKWLQSCPVSAQSKGGEGT